MSNHLKVPETFKGNTLTAEQYRILAGDTSNCQKISDIKKVPKPVKKSKYKNVLVEYDGLHFHSIKERDRYLFLLQLINRGMITNLQRQVEFLLIPKNQLHLEVKYIADFTYYQNRELIVEDVKPFDRKRQRYLVTKDYILKKKMLFHVHKIKITEV